MPALAPPLQPLCLRHEIGDIIKERYVVKSVLGAGAFGTVYRVEETRGSHVVVKACKEMHVLDDPSTTLNEREDALRLFQEEAYLLETLRNAHIPAAYFESVKGTWLACPVCGRTFKGTRNCPDHGAALQVVHERYYLLMDFIEGQDCEQILIANGERPLDETLVLDWALQLCDALEAVHAKGLSHRDIKPANIKIERAANDSGPGRAMLIDFGLVKPSTVAGGYGTVLQRKSTGAGTLGYAPLSPNEQQRPDARTDILALGMTLYRLLTGRDPTEPEDLELMRRSSPRQLNAKLSPAIDEIIKKATQLLPEARYPNVQELRDALRLARYPVEITCRHCGQAQRFSVLPGPDARCERCGRPLAVPDPKTEAKRGATTVPNPYEPKIRELEAEAKKPPQPFSSRHDARIREIEGLLARAARYSVGQTPADECPGCRQAKLHWVSNQPSGQCPLCRAAQLLRRQLDLSTCPVCRVGGLHEEKLADGHIFCPVCRAAPLEEEKHKKFALIQDVVLRCPHCLAAFDVGRNNEAKLTYFGDDPFGVGRGNENATLTLAEWKAKSARGERFLRCDNCPAQWDIAPDERLTLVYFEADPFGTGARFGGGLLSRQAWAKIAQGLSPGVGTHHCPNCASEWNYDRNRGTMTLLEMPPDTPDWAKKWRGIPVSLQAWYLSSGGKRASFAPGFACSNCKTEFDAETPIAPMWKLAFTTNSVLQPAIGQSLSREDWMRKTQGIPTLGEVFDLNAELAKLKNQRAEEVTKSRRAEDARIVSIGQEIRNLWKQSIIEGFVPVHRIMGTTASNGWADLSRAFVPLPLDPLHVPLRATEVLRWESGANKCTMRSAQGLLMWSREASGRLQITSERIMFISRSGSRQNVWQRTINQLRRVDVKGLQGGQLVEMEFEDFKHPVGFEMSDMTWELHADGKTIPLTMTPQDLVSMLMIGVGQ